MKETKSQKCPGCGSCDLSPDHLLEEERILLRAGLDQAFGHNARDAYNTILDLLAAQGIFEVASIFGNRALKKWIGKGEKEGQSNLF